MPDSKSDSAAEGFLLPTVMAYTDAHADARPDADAEVLILFDQFGARLRRYVGSFGLPAQDAEDVVQEVFLSLFRHVRLGRSRENLRGWLFRVANNLALKQRLWKKKRREGVAAHGLIASTAGDHASPEDVLVSEQRQRRLIAVFNGLPERDRRCLSLRAEGLRYREIAHVLGISLGAVAKSLGRSIAKLERADER